MDLSFDIFIKRGLIHPWEVTDSTVTVRLKDNPERSIFCPNDKDEVKQAIQPLYREWWFMKHGGPQ